MSDQNFYALKRVDPHWGDYGDMLIHGMAERCEDGQLALERSGPFAPPIFQPSNTVVVTAEFLTALKGSGLTGFEAGPVIKKRIPKIDWLAWEPYGPEEFKYPAGNEPENYILRRKHSPEAASGLGELFELRLKPGIRVSRESGFHLIRESWTGYDFFVPDGDHFIRNYVSETARDWLFANAGEWIDFEVVHVK